MKIKSLDHYGRGITKVNNKIIFVENALPNEEVEIKIINKKNKYDEAISKKIITISEDRVEPICPYYYNCGGCNIMHMSYESQLLFKQSKINNIIDRYLDKKININEIIYDKSFEYRNKITLQVDNKVGLYQKQTNEVIPINQCKICSHKINEKIPFLNKLDLSRIKQIIIRVSETSDIVEIVGSKDVNIEPIKSYFQNIVIKDHNSIVKKGTGYIEQKIGQIVYQISIDSFFQVNYGVMKKLYEYIKEKVKDNQNVLDLYCGTGSISLYIAGVVKNVCGIEINEQAIKDANNNKKINKIKNANFICSDTKDVSLNKKYDTVIVDPPRSGLNKKIIKEILNSMSDQIIYVSCDPMTMVRDLNALKTSYDIVELTPFDMFPNTYHVECVCVLKLIEH